MCGWGEGGEGRGTLALSLGEAAVLGVPFYLVHEVSSHLLLAGRHEMQGLLVTVSARSHG